MKRQEAELEVGVTRMDNQSISEGYEKFGDNVREKRLKYCEHMQRRESGYTGQ